MLGYLTEIKSEINIPLKLYVSKSDIHVIVEALIKSLIRLENSFEDTRRFLVLLCNRFRPNDFCVPRL